MLRSNLKQTAISAVGLSLLLAGSVCMAKTLTLYEQPATTSKVLGNIDAAKGVVPIFSQSTKAGEWVKVGDPSNGNVGWVPASALAEAATTGQGYAISQHRVNNGKSPGIWIVQYGAPSQMSAAQSQAYMAQFQKNQAAMQRYMQNMFHDYFNGLDAAWMNAPMIMPVVMMPMSPPPPPIAKPQTKTQK